MNSLMSFLALLLLACAGPSTGPANPASASHARQDSALSAGMLQTPDVSATEVVFAYANDLWVVAREGGLARPLASPSGVETRPKFSPDGAEIAFVGNYDGDVDVYVLPVGGGVPKRLTYHPQDEVLSDWSDDGSIVFHANGETPRPGMNRIYKTTSAGGLPQALPMPYGGNGALNASGTELAFTQHVRDHRTWKRYRGGLAADIWIYHLEASTAELITDWQGTDSIPMWHGSVVYYLSDGGPEEKLNIWAYDTADGSRRQVTHFDTYDCRWPSMGPGPNGEGEIVLQNGADIHLVNLADGSTRSLDVTIPGDRPAIRPQRIDVSESISNGDLSPSAKRVAVEARGDIWTLPAENGVARNLTRTSGVAERNPAWSPDGRWVAYACDATGEYELWLTQSDGKEEARQLTHGLVDWINVIQWAPDSNSIYISDDKGRMRLVDVETGALTDFDTDPGGSPVTVSWSHDSKWLTYSRAHGYMESPSIWLYDVAQGGVHRVTSGMLGDGSPTFDRKGDFLYYTTNGSFTATMSAVTTNFVYEDTNVVHAVPLRADVENPRPPKVDEEEFDAEDEQDEPKGDDADAAAESDEAAEEGGESAQDDEGDEEETEEPLVIELEGFEARAFRLDAPAGSYENLSVAHDGALVFAVSGGFGQPGKLVRFDPAADEPELETIVEGTGGYAMNAEGTKLAILRRGKPAIVEPKADAEAEDVPTTGMEATIDPRAEWAQVLRDAWRLFRIYFYDPNMHGVDWEREYERYADLLEDCATRDDVSFLIREMISELNVGHAYYRPGPNEDGPSVPVGLLGCDFELANGAYRITRIHNGAAWDTDAASPLSALGNEVAEGEYLHAVNGTPLDASVDPRAAFLGLANLATVLTVGPDPTPGDSARDVVVTPVRDERNLRYRDWIESNRRYVEGRSEGRLGYIYVPDTQFGGMSDLTRQVVGQLRKDALVIDERWNQGGFIPSRLIDILNRPALAYFAGRTANFTWPPDGHTGPKAMLINAPAGSGGDCFPYFFRQSGLGLLIGKRTWGGLVGLSGNPPLIDGTAVNVPTFAFYELDGTWGVEGHGVDPDLDVEDDPALLATGAEPQLDAAIAHLLKELETKAYQPLDHPRHPVRTGIGIPEEDH